MQQAPRIARNMVLYYGMSEKMPNISYYDPKGQMGSRPYSDERARVVDEEISRIVNEQYQRAKDILAKYAQGHHQVVDELMSKEVIYAADVERIFGKRPWKSRTEELQQVAEERRRQAEAASQQQAAAQQQDAPAAPQDSAPGDDTPLDTSSHSSGDTPPRFNK